MSPYLTRTDISYSEELSKRLVPEILNFLVQTLVLLFPITYSNSKSIPGYFPTPDFDIIGSTLRYRRKRAGDISPKPPSLFSILAGADDGEQAKLNLMSLSLELVGRCADMYKPLDGFIELYDPILAIVGSLPGKKLPAVISQQISQLSDKLSRLLKFAQQARQPLLLQSHKPIPIATYIPKFDAHSSSYMRNKDPNAEREALAKLKAQHRKEKKGAIRELRKDNRFLAGVQQEKQEAKDREYKARMSKAFTSLESERAEQKKEEKEKRREKHRSGRK
jgi:nucleolar protein 14